MWLTAGLFHLVCEERVECLRGLRQLLAGGDALDPGDVRVACEALAAGGGRLINGYGPTETTTFACCHRLGETAQGERIPIGRPIAQARAYVLDGGMELACVGMVGELYLGGEGVARGYLNRPELTAEQFVPDPFSAEAGARLYRTGDLVRWRANGVLEFLGRLDQQVKLRGFRVEPGEVEVVLRAHAGVKEAAVVVRGGEEQEKRLVAYVARNGEQLEEAELRQYLRGLLPEYMVPAAIVFLEALPLTANGKLDRRALPAPAAADEGLNYVAPRTPVEEVVAGIWAEVMERQRVGVYDNFFELGGHSLLALKIISRVREELVVELPLRRLFESPTVAGMVMAIVQGHMEKADDEEIKQLLAEVTRGAEVEAGFVSQGD
jgi:hypothetical protein